MPQVSGVELAQRIGRTRPGVAVLFMSGYSQDVLGSRRALDDGVALIQKPFAAAELLESVRAVIAAASQNKDQATGPTGQPATAS